MLSVNAYSVPSRYCIWLQRHKDVDTPGRQLGRDVATTTKTDCGLAVGSVKAIARHEKVRKQASAVGRDLVSRIGINVGNSTA